MPAGFNKGQIEYIKTIANVNGHKTYKCCSAGSQAHTVITGTPAVSDTHLKYFITTLGERPLVFPTGNVNQQTDVAVDTTMSNVGMENAYYVQINNDQRTANEGQRVTPECFLESINVTMRHITDLDQSIDSQSHKEFRLVVFRHKEKQHWIRQNALNFSNPLYDMFWGPENIKFGPKGYRNKVDEDGNMNYVPFSGYDSKFDRDTMITCPINKDDYVVMKDCRYYLGREYGGKHIYEDRFHWDFEDPIATDLDYLDSTETDKNYCWYIMLLGTNNSTTQIDNLGYLKFLSNTHVTSG